MVTFFSEFLLRTERESEKLGNTNPHNPQVPFHCLVSFFYVHVTLKGTIDRSSYTPSAATAYVYIAARRV